MKTQPGYFHWALLATALVLPSLVTYVYFFLLADSDMSLQRTGMGLAKSIQFGLPLVWFFACKPVPWPTTPRAQRCLWIGVAFGIATFVAMMLLYHGWLKQTAVFAQAANEVREKVTELGFASPLAFLILGTFYVVVHSFLEEYYWRWFVFRGLTQRMSVAAAITVSSLGFMAHHVLVLASYFGWASVATWFFSLSVAVGGAFWAWLYHHGGTLRAAWLSHALIDASIFVIGYGMLHGG